MRTASTVLIALTLVMGSSAVAQNQQQLTGTDQFCIKGSSGPIKCEYRRSRAVWVASGEYIGEMISVTGRTSNSSITLWTDEAKSRQQASGVGRD